MKVTIELDYDTERRLIKLHGSVLDGIEKFLNNEVGSKQHSVVSAFGILTSTYASMKQKYGATFSKDKFVLHFMSDDRYLQLFKEYEKNDFDKDLKPSLIFHKKIKKIKVVTYRERMNAMSKRTGKQVRHLDSGTVYGSINQCALAHDMLPASMHYKLKKKGMEGFVYEEDYQNYDPLEVK